MGDVVSISEAKANLSKLVKRAHAGEIIYVGAYGHAEAILAPVPSRRRIAVGVWRDRRHPDFAYDSEEIIGPDSDLADAVAASLDEAPPQ
ncbi:hypothetical protein [Raineyella sp. W15-4]|uniref:type II toxin-antitoxin system Phd/YefM family antitoxin n=1 Tax=Raineyella sp. W15-4 TaxID=3081651 RepID=UPI0029546D53|nr:hypothetical protein [Raineyella sp. W15-4]WOQ17136.1 hypothetical protein R0145_00040 [Raineyella sp. W15-4]